ncbi:Chromosomal replication initiator protein DnaA [subsurface metagenome]
MEARSAQEIWEAALGELQIQVNKPNYRTWLEKTVGLSYQGNQFVIGVSNTFAAEYLDQNLRSLIEKTLIGLTKHDTKILFRVETTQQNSPTSYRSQREIPSTQQTNLPLFNPKYTFDSFIVGSCNRLAYAAAVRVAENPGYSYNPLFIYGGVGLGKTHLLQAIGHASLAKNMQVLYVSAEQFTNEFTNSIRERKTQEFHNKYRNVDMLLIDDIQFFGGKVQTEENFFHTFNELHNANHQIAVTSDRSPKSMPLLQDRLRSRFEWGLVADIQPPDFETRLAILQAKAGQKEVNVAPDVLAFIAQRIHHNIRELEGSLNRVVAYAKLIRVLLTPELAAQALQDIAGKEPKTASITPHLIIEAVVDSFQLTPQDLKSQKRDKETALARQVAMYLIRQEASWSLTQIGKELGGRGPATVSHAYEKIANDINNSPYLRRKISDIQKKISSKQKGWNY